MRDSGERWKCDPLPSVGFGEVLAVQVGTGLFGVREK